MHQFALGQIERMPQRGQEAQVFRALRVYRETYETTQSRQAAVFRMRSALTDPEIEGAAEAPKAQGGVTDP